MDKQISLFDANAEYFDEFDENTTINNLNFKVHASVIYKLGESLIADEITALSELMKNSYDADASFCNLMIDPSYTDEKGRTIGKIEISDNGIGMDLRTIVNGWLTISNSPKKKMKKDNITTEKFNRIPLGEKGLGRLSVQKLGREVTMVTKTKDSSLETTLTIPWEEFLKNTTLDKINISCEQKEVHDNKSYTKIIITKLINIEFWESDEVKKNLEKTINQIVSPFRFKDNNFIISAKIGDFKIDVNNALFNDVLKTSRSNYSFAVDKNEVKLHFSYKTDFFKKRNIIKDYPFFDFKRDYFADMVGKIEKKYNSVKYENEGDYLYSLCIDIPLEEYSVLKRDKDGKLYYPGDFDGEIFDFSYDSQYIAEIISNNDFVYALKEQEYKDYIKNNKGIKVVRDGFVVQGYGDGNVDWLNISTSATTTGKYADLRNENIIGYIKITGKNNQALKETTSREGFISDEYYQNFYAIIRDIIIRKINKVNKDLTEIFKNYLKEVIVTDNPELEYPIQNVISISEKSKKISQDVNEYVQEMQEKITSLTKTTTDALQQKTFVSPDIESQYEEIINHQATMINELKKRFDDYLIEVESLKKSMTIIENDFDSFNQKISDVFELAGLGISVELFTHELYTTINNVNEKISGIIPLTDELKYVLNSMNSLRKQISYFHPGLKYVRMKKEEVLLKTLIDNHKEFYDNKAKSKDISIKIVDNSSNCRIMTNIGLLNQVLDNVFSNSFYWLQYSRDSLKLIQECCYNIVINNDASLEIWDNGIGISKDIERDLFNPFVSCKKDGRGLGLFICKNNLENNNASIRLSRERNEHGNLFKFKIDLSNLKVDEVY